MNKFIACVKTLAAYWMFGFSMGFISTIFSMGLIGEANNVFIGFIAVFSPIILYILRRIKRWRK